MVTRRRKQVMCGDQTVLIVDDDPACRELHAVWLADRFDILTAADGSEALEYADGADVVLLDRQMPGMKGIEVARRIREQPGECYVVVVSGVEPDLDVVDAPIDEYLLKPVSREDVVDAVERMLARSRCQDLHRKFYSLAARKATLEVRKSAADLADSEEYQRLVGELEATRVEFEGLLADLDDEWRRTVMWTLAGERTESGETAGERLRS